MPKKILLIQDDPSDVQAVREALILSNDGAFQVDSVGSCSEGLERLANGGDRKADDIAAVLVDLSWKFEIPA